MCMDIKWTESRTKAHPIQAWKLVRYDSDSRMFRPYWSKWMNTIDNEWVEASDNLETPGSSTQIGHCAFLSREHALAIMGMIGIYSTIPYQEHMLIPVKLAGQIDHGVISEHTVGSGLPTVKGQYIRI